jgi:AbiV family abortive infection protein
MKKVRDYDVNKKLLKEYEIAAIANAEEILSDAKALLVRKSYARAYFLAIASIEETGKAYMAFCSRGRNLSNDGLKKKLKMIFENHPQKIVYAFFGWIFASSKLKESALTAVDLTTDLKLGREVSMYVDAYPDGSIRMPSNVIRPVAAIDSVRIAENCLHHTKEYVKNNLPKTTSSFDDKLLCIRSEKIDEMFKRKDFWEFFLAKLETDASNFSYAKAVVTYHDSYFCKKKQFSTKKTNK